VPETSVPAGPKIRVDVLIEPGFLPMDSGLPTGELSDAEPEIITEPPGRHSASDRRSVRRARPRPPRNAHSPGGIVPERRAVSAFVRCFQILGAIGVIIAVGVVAISAVSTSSARVGATTTGSSFLETATVELSQPDSAVELLFDRDGLYPGLEVSACVVVAYSGSVPADVRLHAAEIGQAGLAPLVEFRLELGPPTCDETLQSATLVFDDRLAALWATHGSYASGLELQNPMVGGEQLSLTATATVVDDNAAQGLASLFSVTIEARP
jgi:hypothetical protein